MKRRPIIGLCITGLVVSILLGIASLPDEVLIESSTTENSNTVTENTQFVPTSDKVTDIIPKSLPDKTTDKTSTELNSLKKELDQVKNELNQLKSVADIPEEPPENAVPQEDNVGEQSEGNVIVINLSDGVGSQER